MHELNGEHFVEMIKKYKWNFEWKEDTENELCMVGIFKNNGKLPKERILHHKRTGMFWRVMYSLPCSK